MPVSVSLPWLQLGKLRPREPLEEAEVLGLTHLARRWHVGPPGVIWVPCRDDRLGLSSGSAMRAGRLHWVPEEHCAPSPGGRE